MLRHQIEIEGSFNEVRHILVSSVGRGKRQQLTMIVNPNTSQVSFEVEWDNKVIYRGVSIEQATNCYNCGPKANEPMSDNGIYYGKGYPRHWCPSTVVR